MTTGATGQLGLALPVQGELSGTWGDTVNNGLTQYINIAIAGTLTLTNDGAVTLANTTGDASASNVTSTLTGAGTVTAQFAIVRVTGTLTTAKVVTAPSYSKTYTVVNAATGGIVTFKASGQTGVSIAVGESAFVYFNGTDYVKVSGTASVTSFSAGTTGLTPSTSTTGAVTLAGTLAIANGGTGQTTANTALNALLPSQTGNANKYLQTDGTNSSWDAVSLSTADITGTLGTANGGTNLTSFTSGGVVYASSSSALATAAGFTYDGTATFRLTNGTAGYFRGPTDMLIGEDASSLYIGEGFGANPAIPFKYGSSGTTFQAWKAGGSEQMRLTGTGLGIGTSSPAAPLNVQKTGTGSVTSILLSRTTENAADQQSILWKSNDLALDYAAIAGVIDSGTAGSMQFKTATGGTLATKLTLDSAGNLLVGTTTPVFDASGRGLVTINGSSAAAVGFTASGADKGIILHTGTNMIMSNSVSGAITFQTTNTERARIPAAGGFQSKTTISVGDATPSLSGAGITFPAAQSASSDANTLDDYEEGTWTPALGGFSSITYSAQTGTYTKIGNVVNVVCKIIVSGGTRTSADLQVFSLPFTSASQENSGGSWGYGYGVVASSVGLPQLRINASATTVSLLNTAGVVLAGTDLNTATPTINFSATYTV